jgi:hypothetical protein
VASQGPLSPGTLVSLSDVGTVAWANVTNAAASDNARAEANIATSAVSHYLKATNFGFTIPSGATIDGIVVEVERREESAAGIRDNRVRIVKGGVVGSTDKADTATNWPASDAYKTYGSASDLWGQTWTGSDINSSTFGMVIAATWTVAGSGLAEIDHIRITVHYTTGITLVATAGAATAQATAPTPVVRLAPPAGGATASASAPGIQSDATQTIVPPVGIATASATAPSVVLTQDVSLTATAGTATASGSELGLGLLLEPPAGTATAEATAPSVHTASARGRASISDAPRYRAIISDEPGPNA